MLTRTNTNSFENSELLDGNSKEGWVILGTSVRLLEAVLVGSGLSGGLEFSVMLRIFCSFPFCLFLFVSFHPAFADCNSMMSTDTFFYPLYLL